MQNLKEGLVGPEVVKLQEKLKEIGFNPGLVDGEFGPATKAAVKGMPANREKPLRVRAAILTMNTRG